MLVGVAFHRIVGDALNGDKHWQGICILARSPIEEYRRITVIQTHAMVIELMVAHRLMAATTKSNTMLAATGFKFKNNA